MSSTEAWRLKWYFKIKAHTRNIRYKMHHQSSCHSPTRSIYKQYIYICKSGLHSYCSHLHTSIHTTACAEWLLSISGINLIPGKLLGWICQNLVACKQKMPRFTQNFYNFLVNTQVHRFFKQKSVHPPKVLQHTSKVWVFQSLPFWRTRKAL